MYGRVLNGLLFKTSETTAVPHECSSMPFRSRTCPSLNHIAHVSTRVASGCGGNPLRRAWQKDEMACINSVGQDMVSNDFLPPVTTICWSFPSLESEAANRGDCPAWPAQRWRNGATNGDLSQTTSVYERDACRLDLFPTLHCWQPELSRALAHTKWQ